MYNVLEKLRSGEALSAKEKKIHDDGLVSVLKKIHDDLDDAAAAAEKPSRRRGSGTKAAAEGRTSAKTTKPAWPKDLAEQTRAVRGVLAAGGGVVTAADVARQFKHAKAPRVEEILATLVALGHARRTDTGYAPA